MTFGQVWHAFLFSYLLSWHKCRYAIVGKLRLKTYGSKLPKFNKHQFTAFWLIKKLESLQVNLTDEQERDLSIRLGRFLYIYTKHHLRLRNIGKRKLTLDRDDVYEYVVEPAIRTLYLKNQEYLDQRHIRQWCITAIIVILECSGWFVRATFEHPNLKNRTYTILNKITISKKGMQSRYEDYEDYAET